MRVIKLGGSLSHSSALTRCMESVNRDYREHAVVIVPGGGAFADQVRMAQRHWRFDERTAHDMAVLAMQQMARMFKALQPDWRLADSVADIAVSAAPGLATIWSPQISELDRAGIAASWDVTSDSLAAWLAARLPAKELILVKSASIPASVTIEELQAQHIIDPAFHHYRESGDFTLSIKNQQQF
ncbi:uridylate kinase [Methylomarinum sp. Ch1-1]|uniref:Uridylate kinase n=1 Tax=Methylomarinum roseum TaxID=3067653 RepID=A0AAU7NRT4_9GAMM|nr:uridylate kinase [Methylomarinum sp. Ch1-1]MDP4520357.1 uridylate kinase [Methylomarinum sp. Ch1-1]